MGITICVELFGSPELGEKVGPTPLGARGLGPRESTHAQSLLAEIGKAYSELHEVLRTPEHLEQSGFSSLRLPYGGKESDQTIETLKTIIPLAENLIAAVPDTIGLAEFHAAVPKIVDILSLAAPYLPHVGVREPSKNLLHALGRRLFETTDGSQLDQILGGRDNVALAEGIAAAAYEHLLPSHHSVGPWLFARGRRPFQPLSHQSHSPVGPRRAPHAPGGLTPVAQKYAKLWTTQTDIVATESNSFGARHYLETRGPFSKTGNVPVSSS